VELGRQAAEFHLRNARAWANRATGEDLSAQIDPGYVFGTPAGAAPVEAASAGGASG
jgi:CO dehydrogenase maturation factor